MNGSTRKYIQAFRVKELQECLDRLGVRKTGKKDDLRMRLMAVFNDEASSASNQTSRQWRQETAARIVEDVYARMIGGSAVAPSSPGVQRNGGASTSGFSPGGNSLAASSLAGAQQTVAAAANAVMAAAGPSYAAGGGSMNAAVGDAMAAAALLAAAPAMLNTRVRCICGVPVEKPHMVQCGGANCGVWQHAECVGLPRGGPPARWFCEQCHAELADPFWEALDVVLPPTLLRPTGRMVMVGNAQHPVKVAEKGFVLQARQYELIKRRSDQYRLQLVCIKLGDPVPFRMHWPLNAEVKVNTMGYRVYGRSPSAKLGANQRDEPANISMLCVPSRNTLSVVAADGGTYLIAVRLARLRPMALVKALMKPPLGLEDAVQRVRQELSGGDDDILASNTVLSLRCPLSGARMKTPARFVDVPGLPCFDLDCFLSMAERTRKWQCPHSMRHGCVQGLQQDAYTQRILDCLQQHPDVTEVEVAPDGRWRPYKGSQAWSSVMEPFQWGAAAANANASAGPLIKPEPADGSQQRPQKPSACAAAAPGSDEESEDEAAELRRAAQAVATARKRPAPPPKEVIDLLSDSDDDRPLDKRPSTQGPGGTAPRPPPPLPAPQQGNGSGAGHPSSGGGGAAPAPSLSPAPFPSAGKLRIRLTGAVLQQASLTTAAATSSRPVQPPPQHASHGGQPPGMQSGGGGPPGSMAGMGPMGGPNWVPDDRAFPYGRPFPPPLAWPGAGAPHGIPPPPPPPPPLPPGLLAAAPQGTAPPPADDPLWAAFHMFRQTQEANAGGAPYSSSARPPETLTRAAASSAQPSPSSTGRGYAPLHVPHVPTYDSVYRGYQGGSGMGGSSNRQPLGGPLGGPLVGVSAMPFGRPASGGGSGGSSSGGASAGGAGLLRPRQQTGGQPATDVIEID